MGTRGWRFDSSHPDFSWFESSYPDMKFCRSCDCELSDLDEQLEICSEASLGNLCWIYFTVWLWANREEQAKELGRLRQRKILQSDEYVQLWRIMLDDWLSHVLHETESLGIAETFEHAAKLAALNK